ncbi:Phage related protein [Clostridium acetobutylicum EA 2018]|nr:Phage related protein [Clostridium acetobutylicum EA 2018]OOL96075.1 hypothetical protein CLACE_29900 [Clostridium acetobutylicum]OOM01356.1 hypothetical protein CLABU_39170 [Clostridium acetobutylicum]
MLNQESNIKQLFELCTYYYAKEPLLANSVKNVLVPFSMSSWKLEGEDGEIKDQMLDYLDSISIDDLLRDLFHDFYVYQNLFGYIKENGTPELFAPWRIKVSSIAENGNPVLEFSITEILNKPYSITNQEFIDTISKAYDGYPIEVVNAIKGKNWSNSGTGWIQLNPKHTFCIQAVKSRWSKYATPVICSALEALGKKQLISIYEDSQLNNGMKSFLQVNVGDKDHKKTININDIEQVGKIYKDAINGYPLAVVSWNVDSQWKNMDTKSLFDKNKYQTVNESILSSIGISAIVVTGNGGSGSFAQASINLSTLAKRIKDGQNKIAKFINLLLKRKFSGRSSTSDGIPSFKFESLNLQSEKDFRSEVMQLYTFGLLSRETTLSELKFDFKQEKKRRESENSENLDIVFSVPPSFNHQSSNSSGRHEEENSDKDKSLSGKQPKPSTVSN